MRTYKFRGKDSNGNWRYGHLLTIDTDTNRVFIREMNPVNEPPRYTDYQVNPESVGQCTEKWDKKGVDIYEKDVLERNGKMAVVSYNQARMCFEITPLLAESLRADAQVLIVPSSMVIWNIIDTPELVQNKVV